MILILTQRTRPTIDKGTVLRTRTSLERLGQVQELETQSSLTRRIEVLRSRRKRRVNEILRAGR
jgi:hypothetical protein